MPVSESSAMSKSALNTKAPSARVSYRRSFTSWAVGAHTDAVTSPLA